MQSIRRVLAVVGLVGLGGLASSAGADPNQLDGFVVVGEAPMVAVLNVTAPPELAGAPCTILWGPEIGMGTPIGQTVLLPGSNMLAVPNMPGPGWYTAIGPFEARGLDGNDNGYN